MQESSKTTHLYFAELANDSYGDTITLEGYKTQFFNVDGCQAFLLSSPIRQIAVFRGTDEAGDIYPSLSLPLTDGVKTGLRRYADKILRLMRSSLSGKPIYLVGHSLGGAVACVFADMLNQSDITIYSYGSPKAGTKAFSERIRDIKHYRWANAYDIVPMIPFFRCTHHGTLMYLCADGAYRDLTWWQRIKDRYYGRFKPNSHRITHYIESLSQH